MQDHQTNILDIVSRFDIEGSIRGYAGFGSGHINDTYRLFNEDAKKPDYLLQRINHYVFKNVDALMQNIHKVTLHLKEKLTGMPGGDPLTQTMTIVPTKNGQLFFVDKAGQHWRMFHFLKGTKSYDQVSNVHQAYEGGKAFGTFQRILADLDPAELTDTIPGFHDMELRLRQLDEALAADKANRAYDVDVELTFIKERADAMCSILRLGKAGKLPLRIIHNDTKFNNVLLDAEENAQCVVDLDTVMPGYVAYDMGDAVRTIINTAAEDEADADKIQLNIALFEAYVKGYFVVAKGFLTDAEIDSLIPGVLMLPFIQAVRFLTDHLNGDVYFKIHHLRHNLQRARAQMELVRKLGSNVHTLSAIVDRYRA